MILSVTPGTIVAIVLIVILFVLSSNGLIASSLSINHSFNSSVVIL